MKKVILIAGLLVASMTVTAQTLTEAEAKALSESYFVKTKNVKPKAKAEGQSVEEAEDTPETADEELSFIGRNFKYKSMCDWNVKDSLKFMVMPEKYDLVVRTFVDAATGKEVSSMKLRHSIMVYMGHDEGPNGHDRVNFYCQNDQKMYYYEIPGGSFEDHCYGKLGVPTLAYLGDVDTARELLVGKKVFTEGQIYYIDTESDGDGYQEVRVDKNREVTIAAVGVGTRAYPVKIIVADSTQNGKEFFINVAISRTNCGFREEEVATNNDDARHLFENAFRLVDETGVLPNDVADLIGKTIYSRVELVMNTRGDGKERDVKMPRLTEFKIDEIKPIKGSRYVTLSLTESEARRNFTVETTFDAYDAEGGLNERNEKYFSNMFGIGEGKLRNTNPATRAMIREGRVGNGMTEDEVELAVGVPDKTSVENGITHWYYNRSQGKRLHVVFSKTGKVTKYEVLR